MTDQAIDAAVKNYVRKHLSPTDDEQDYVKDKYGQLKDFLAQSCFKSGSFARFTAIHPMHDLDVIWVTSNPEIMDNPIKLLQALADDLVEQYRKAGGPQPKITVQTHSVTLKFDDFPELEDGFSIDVVPAIPSLNPELKNEFGDPIFIVPEVLKMNHRKRNAFYAEHRPADEVGWVYTDPKGYVKQTTELDEASGGNHRKDAKLLKAWRHGRKTVIGDAFKLKSFHTEQICAAQFTEYPVTTAYDGLRNCFNVLSDYVIEAPCIEDKAYALLEEQKFIDAYLDDEHATTEDKKLILKEIAAAVLLIGKLAHCNNETEVFAVLDQLTQTEEPSSPAARVARAVTYSAPARPWSKG